MLVVAAAMMVLALFVARARLAPRFRARHGVERVMTGLMIFCSLVAIITTLGIVASLLFEAFRFFQMVPVTEFFFG
jgi:phosphate transport system permease protein